MAKTTKATVRMYCMGTGDCFVIKFYAGNKETFKMMIDCGTWAGSKEKLSPYIIDIKKYVNNHINILVITHEHKDHVHLFDACEDLLTKDLKIDRIWMGWPENDRDAKVKKWQKHYGDKRKALFIAVKKLQEAFNADGYKNSVEKEFNGETILDIQQKFSIAINDLNELHNTVNTNAVGDRDYIGGLSGMNIVKKNKEIIEYYSPGDIIKQIPELEGITFYILGPPQSWAAVEVQEGGRGESYAHNKELIGSDAFVAAVLGKDDLVNTHIPFPNYYVSNEQTLIDEIYNKEGNEWRRIDTDWLSSVGHLALRINSITNNLSLALAIEFEESGRVMLFPGDAEYGSWASWHRIEWNVPCRNGKAHFTEDLLSRTVFYKVAHHLSHHGTAVRLGMELMTHPDLVAMATLDYNVISSGWKNTMPNKLLLRDLISKTKGRLIIMNDQNIFYNQEHTLLVNEKLKQEREKMQPKELTNFNKAYKRTKRFHQFTVDGNTSTC